VLDLSATSQVMGHIVKVLFILVIIWSAIKIMDYLDIWLLRKSHFPKESSLYGLFTKYHLLKNIAKLFIFILAIALLLLSFDSVREIGKGMLVSAGVASALLALSAQKLVSILFPDFN